MAPKATLHAQNVALHNGSATLALRSGLSESFGVTSLDFRNHAFWRGVAQDHALEGLPGNLIESRLNDGVGDHTPALLDNLLPTLLVGGFGRGKVRIVVNARPGHDFAATGREHLRSWAGHVFDELPSGVLAWRVGIDVELETVDRVLATLLQRWCCRPC